MTDEVLDLAAVAPGRFSVISLCDVLEHTASPPAVLDAVRAGLRDDGVVFISCPNIESLAWVTLDAENVNPYWSEIEHYHNFGFRRLRSLLADRGFRAVSCSVSNRYRVCMDVVAIKS
jgi:2-polyprenyl-3-methyl-5-hydroxy-6-metoxy-1,4-benzoquinol methylase